MPRALTSKVRAVSRNLSDWRLLAGAAAAQVVTACALRTLSLSRVRAGAARLRRLARLVLPGSDDRVLWAIEATGRRLTGISTCLVRALVVDARLSAVGRGLRVTIGVKRSSVGTLQSHAWVADSERVLVGGPIDREIVSIVSWESAA
jgi:hypothetical protein